MSENEILENVEEDVDGMSPIIGEIPTYGSEKWNEYVMSQFNDNELIGGAPTCDGCRRVVEKLIGPIISTQIVNNTAPCLANAGTATVSVNITVVITNENHPAFNICGRIVVEDIADVNRDNTDAPYNLHQSATAATRAEGRALRKLLRLTNVITAEEKSEKTESDIDWVPDDPITNDQINVIDMMCGSGRLNIDVMGFINSGRKVYANIGEVGKSTAQKMIQELNAIQRKVKPRPSGLDIYKVNWSKNFIKGE